MQAALTTTRAAAYTLQEMKSPAGTTVREYISAGKVFAIAWNGPYPPNLKQLLGTYSTQFEQAMQSTNRVGRRPISIRQSNLVVQIAGHMGSFSGRAFLPKELPAGMTEEEVH